jgi:hypothetical protein
MPAKKPLRGASAKEQRQYEHILESAREEGRYGKRAKEVAARTVMKEHGEKGHKPHRPASGRTTRKTTARKRTTARSTAHKTSSRSAHRGRSNRS